MKRTPAAVVLHACVVAGAVAGTACEGTGFPVFPTPVVTPEDVEDGDSAAPVADDSELKAEPPAAVAPVDDVEIADTRPILVASQARGRFVDAVFGHEFALYRRVGGGLSEVEVGRGARRGDGSAAYRVRRQLDRRGSYAWRARAILDGAPGPWSEDALFRVAAAALTPPRPLAPYNGAVGVFGGACPNPLFTVRNATLQGRADTIGVQVEVARNESFRAVVARAETFQRARGETDLCVASPLAPDTLYFWRARARLPSDLRVVSDWSAVWRFTTARRR
ncbi:MAG: hypothetical protein OXF93_01000 [Acidobacteria bacterium]|nr:hypothetical protein [Acidobacteriota bacterium]